MCCFKVAPPPPSRTPLLGALLLCCEQKLLGARVAGGNLQVFPFLVLCCAFLVLAFSHVFKYIYRCRANGGRGADLRDSKRVVPPAGGSRSIPLGLSRHPNLA